MNIFYLDNDPMVCAQYHNDKHVVKMILEYAQLLSTAHRVLDGTECTVLSKSGRKKKVFTLPDVERDNLLYNATHINHPSAKWVRHSGDNYRWLYRLFRELCSEYTFRYGKVHLTDTKLKSILKNVPKNISDGEFCAPWRAMPDDYKIDKSVKDYTMESYRAYYKGAKSHMFNWKNREVPSWVNI